MSTQRTFSVPFEFLNLYGKLAGNAQIFLLLHILSQMGDTPDQWTPSFTNDDIAARLGCSLRSVIYAIKDLRTRGMVDAQRVPGVNGLRFRTSARMWRQAPEINAQQARG